MKKETEDNICRIAVEDKIKIFRLNSEYTVEVQREGEFNNFYLVKDSNKFFCFGIGKRYPVEELFDQCEEYIPFFEEELQALDDYYQRKW